MKDAILYDKARVWGPQDLTFRILESDISADKQAYYDDDEDYMERYNDDEAYYGTEMRASPGKRHIVPKAPQQPKPGSQEQNQYR